MSASRPARPRIFGAPPPIMIGGPGRWTGCGRPANPLTSTYSPCMSICSPDQWARITSTYSAELGDAHARPRHRHAEPVVLVAHPSGTEPDLEPPVGQHVERRHLLGEHDRVMEVAGEHPAADAQRRRPRGGHRDRRQRGHVDRSVTGRLGDRTRPEVVVGTEQRGVAEVLGTLHACRTSSAAERLRTPARRTGTVAARHRPPSISDSSGDN